MSLVANSKSAPLSLRESALSPPTRPNTAAKSTRRDARCYPTPQGPTSAPRCRSFRKTAQTGAACAISIGPAPCPPSPWCSGWGSAATCRVCVALPSRARSLRDRRTAWGRPVDGTAARRAKMRATRISLITRNLGRKSGARTGFRGVVCTSTAVLVFYVALRRGPHMRGATAASPIAANRPRGAGNAPGTRRRACGPAGHFRCAPPRR